VASRCGSAYTGLRAAAFFAVAFRAVVVVAGSFAGSLAGAAAAFLRIATSYLPPFCPLAAGTPVAFLSTAFAPVWPRKRRVGENSPSLWPTMFSVTYTGMNLLPLCTANVWPTKSGSTVLARDHVFTTFFSLL